MNKQNPMRRHPYLGDAMLAGSVGVKHIQGSYFGNSETGVFLDEGVEPGSEACALGMALKAEGFAGKSEQIESLMDLYPILRVIFTSGTSQDLFGAVICWNDVDELTIEEIAKRCIKIEKDWETKQETGT